MQSSSRGKAKVRLLAVHTTEGIMRAAGLRAWASWPGSSHASADETGVLLSGAGDGFVDYDHSAWTMLSANPISDQIELCGFAKWKRDDWLARPKLLDACARWLAARSVARGIPLVRLTVEEIRAGKAGVIGHVDWTRAVEGTHTDPGEGFPWDVVLSKATAHAGGGIPLSEEDDMSQYADQLDRIEARLRGSTDRPYDMLQSIESLAADVQNRVRGAHPAMDSLQVIQWQLGQLAAQKPGGLTAADVVALIPDGIASDVVDELRRRLATGPVS